MTGIIQGSEIFEKYEWKHHSTLSTRNPWGLLALDVAVIAGIVLGAIYASSSTTPIYALGVTAGAGYLAGRIYLGVCWAIERAYFLIRDGHYRELQDVPWTYFGTYPAENSYYTLRAMFKNDQLSPTEKVFAKYHLSLLKQRLEHHKIQEYRRRALADLFNQREESDAVIPLFVDRFGDGLGVAFPITDTVNMHATLISVTRNQDGTYNVIHSNSGFGTKKGQTYGQIRRRFTFKNLTIDQVCRMDIPGFIDECERGLHSKDDKRAQLLGARAGLRENAFIEEYGPSQVGGSCAAIVHEFEREIVGKHNQEWLDWFKQQVSYNHYHFDFKPLDPSRFELLRA